MKNLFVMDLDQKTETLNTTFPPLSIEDFLTLCTGQWMVLCSSFELSNNDTDWHNSEKAMIKIELSSNKDQLKQVVLNTTSSTSSTRYFLLDGSFTSEDSISGQWKLKMDGSLELTYRKPFTEEEEHQRIWFKKPNLRLCSILTLGSDNTLLGAKFYSEIRRLNQSTI